MDQDRVGKRVRVLWPEEEEWFEGTIREYDDSQGFYVVYDDGDERWEPKEQAMQIEEGEEATDTSSARGLMGTARENDRAPEMMEPPPSPGSGSDGDEEEHEDLPAEHQEPGSSYDSEAEEPTEGQDDQQQENEADQGEEGQNEEQEGDIDPCDLRNDLADAKEESPYDSSDNEQSIAASEIPQTFERASDSRLGTDSRALMAPVPIKGVLVGRVLRASGLRSDKAPVPSAFVKAAFVKAGDTSSTSLMLRCKETLSTTAVVRNSNDPVWSEDPSSDQEEDDFGSRSGLQTKAEHRKNGDFRLQLVPPIAPPTNLPAWLELSGDLLFTVYMASASGSSSRRGTNEHLGQAAVSLQSLLRDLLSCSPSTTRFMELKSRNGKRLGQVRGSMSSSFAAEEAERPELVVSFRFLPTYERSVRQEAAATRSLSKTPSSSKLGSRVAPAKDAFRGNPRQSRALSAKRTPAGHTSSSCVNRRRFEKQVASDNRALAKRLEWKQARRSRYNAEAKAQEKKKVTPPQHGARKHDHKASSGINRTKFVQQVAQENKSLGKRLQTILGAKQTGDLGSWTTAEAKNSGSVDYLDRDKTHVLEKRWQRQVELDFLMEKAQTKYQQQNQTVEEVTGLQEEVATLRNEVETLTRTANRLEILNKKDQHVRDCLTRAAAVATGASTPRQANSNSKRSRAQSTGVNNSTSINQEDSERSGKPRKEQEWELLIQHQDCLQAEKTRQSQELQALNQQELELNQEIHDRQTQWELAVATQAFHRQMEKPSAVQVQQAIREMKRKQKHLELSQEEEEQWTLYQTHQELKQLKIATQILRDQRAEGPGRVAVTRGTSSSASSAACDYLLKKIGKQKEKIQQLQVAVEQRRLDHTSLLASGGHESLRKRVQELQRLVFLCKTQATHVKRAERLVQRKGEQQDLAFQRQLFHEQTETEILFKKQSGGRQLQQ
ncbi:hypothetical protein BBJ28_00006596 [Nothophytophthora sp. Chile5]|nr:hypothetical protein BBJ28_00006596 [Nothophytophthora sp. Chile5]